MGLDTYPSEQTVGKMSLMLTPWLLYCYPFMGDKYLLYTYILKG